VIAPDGAVTLYSGKVDMGTGAARGVPGRLSRKSWTLHSRAIAMIEGRHGAFAPIRAAPAAPPESSMGGVQIRQAAASARGPALLALAAKTF